MKRILILIWTCFLTMFLGCGEKHPEGMPPLYKTSIVLKEKETPIEGVNVSLYNADHSLPKWNIGGFSDENGVVRLKTYSKYNGVPEGTYKLVLSKKQYLEKLEPPVPGSSIEEINQYEKLLSKYSPVELIPQQYTSVATTTLNIT
ncbi:MAG: carboxypeptidase-like regulatory domain-containing protein, partial [Planctomycetaceae bacterium]|nr:carboxypeptidase-like regulatory domain-containing protein [Planctomycetaceae bacterium]